MKIKLTKSLMVFTAVLMLSGGLTAYAATTLFTQTFPSQTFATATLTEGPTCSGGNLVLYAEVSTIPSFAGSPATLDYACDSTGDAVFSTTGTTSTTVTVTPTFTVPAGWTLGVTTPVTGVTPCASPTPLTSGSPITLTGGSYYDYCLTSSSASSFSSFTIQWAQ